MSKVSWANRIDSYFEVSYRGSTIGTEIRAGFVTFVTMSYIIFVNPNVLSLAGNIDSPGGVMKFDSILTATVLSSAFASILVGMIGNLPFGLAPGMGLNSYFTYGCCIKLGLSWQVSLTACFVQGILFAILSMLGVCSLIQQHAPACIKKSITVGLGLFQALIGFEAMRLVTRGDLVLLSLGNLWDPSIWLSLFGVVIISVLLVLKFKGAMLLGMVIVTGLAWSTGLSPMPTGIFAMPDLSGTAFQLDFAGYFANIAKTSTVTMVFLFVSIFDTAGVQFAAGSAAYLLDDEGRLPRAREAFLSAGVATAVGAALGTSPVIIHNETCAGIEDGGRTGLVAVTVGVCFLIALPFAPLFEALPQIACAPPLVVVGMLMMSCIKFIDWTDIQDSVPAFLVICMLPFTYSIANGMLFGIAAYGLLQLSTTTSRILGLGGAGRLPHIISPRSARSGGGAHFGRSDELDDCERLHPIIERPSADSNEAL